MNSNEQAVFEENKMKIEFKSLPEYFAKEKSGVKNNTVRIVDIADARFKILSEHNCGERDLEIVIENKDTGEKFKRTLKDVTFFNAGNTADGERNEISLVIITWRE